MRNFEKESCQNKQTKKSKYIFVFGKWTLTICNDFHSKFLSIDIYRLISEINLRILKEFICTIDERKENLCFFYRNTFYTEEEKLWSFEFCLNRFTEDWTKPHSKKWRIFFFMCAFDFDSIENGRKRKIICLAKRIYKQLLC